MTKRELEEVNEALALRVEELERQRAALPDEAKPRATVPATERVEAMLQEHHSLIETASQELDEATARLGRLGQGMMDQITDRTSRLDQVADRLKRTSANLSWKHYASTLVSAMAGAVVIFILLMLLCPGWTMTERQQQDEWAGQMLRVRVQKMDQRERKALNDLLGFPLARVEEEP